MTLDGSAGGTGSTVDQNTKILPKACTRSTRSAAIWTSTFSQASQAAESLPPSRNSAVRW